MLWRVRDIVGNKKIGDVTLDDYQQVMREIDVRGERKGKKRKLAKATRRQIGQVMRHVLVLALYPTRHITTNPIPESALLAKGQPKGLQFPYPEEDALLMADRRHDLGHRVLFRILHRLG